MQHQRLRVAAQSIESARKGTACANDHQARGQGQGHPVGSRVEENRIGSGVVLHRVCVQRHWSQMPHPCRRESDIAVRSHVPDGQAPHAFSYELVAASRQDAFRRCSPKLCVSNIHRVSGRHTTAHQRCSTVVGTSGHYAYLDFLRPAILTSCSNCLSLQALEEWSWSTLVLTSRDLIHLQRRRSTAVAEASGEQSGAGLLSAGRAGVKYLRVWNGPHCVHFLYFDILFDEDLECYIRRCCPREHCHLRAWV
jgi:hypothetical protein